MATRAPFGILYLLYSLFCVHHLFCWYFDSLLCAFFPQKVRFLRASHNSSSSPRCKSWRSTAVHCFAVRLKGNQNHVCPGYGMISPSICPTHGTPSLLEVCTSYAHVPPTSELCEMLNQKLRSVTRFALLHYMCHKIAQLEETDIKAIY